MVIHHPPSPSGFGRYIAATALLLPLWLVVLTYVPSPTVGGMVGATIVTFVLSPSLGVLFWQWFAKRQYAEELRETKRGGEAGRRRRRRGEARYTFSRDDDDVFSRVLEDADTMTPAPGAICLACLRRPEKQAVFWQPMMIFQHLFAAVEIWLVVRGGMYAQCLVLPAPMLVTLITLVWLVIGAPAWNVLEIRDGKAWLDDVDKSALRAHERERITAAGPTEDGIFVVLERQGKVRLWFPGGSLPAEVQRDIALDALRAHGGAAVSTGEGDTRSGESAEVSS